MPTSDTLERISHIRTRAQLFIIDELARRGIEDVVPSHGVVLAYLYRNKGPLPVTSLVLALRRPKSTITKTNPDDGRSYLVELTPRGKEFYSVFMEISERLEERLFAGLSAEDRQTFSRLLRVLEENLD